MSNQILYPDLSNETDPLFTHNLSQTSTELPMFTPVPNPTAPTTEWEYDFLKTPFNGTYDTFSNYTKSNHSQNIWIRV